MSRAARCALAGIVAAGVLAACATRPPPPDWQIEARGAAERAVAAWLDGNPQVEAVEAARAHRAAAATGDPAIVARLELLRCAARVASLEFGPCAAFEPWRADAGEPERAYADYLAARAAPAQIALLPEAQRGAAAAPAQASAQALAAIGDPLARLVAAGVMFESGRASPGAIAIAADTASAQGWRRPLLAWLGVQRDLAERGGDAAEAQRLQRRIDLAARRR